MKLALPTFWKHVLTVLGGALGAQALPLLAARGVPFQTAPEQQSRGGWLSAFEDPDGNELHLVQQSPR